MFISEVIVYHAPHRCLSWILKQGNDLNGVLPVEYRLMPFTPADLFTGFTSGTDQSFGGSTLDMVL